VKIRKSFHKNQSILNTDAFDKRRFKEIFEMSKGLQKVRSEAELPLFEPLLGDIWASLYKMKPQIIVCEKDNILLVNQTLMQRVMMDASFVKFKRFTRLNDLLSTIGTVKLGEKTNQWLAEQKKSDEDFRKQIEEIHDIQKQLKKLEWQEEINNRRQATEMYFIESMTKLEGKLQQMLHENSESFSQALDQATEETKLVKESIKSLLGGVSSGSGDANLKKIPLREKILLAEKIAIDKQVKEIADWAGRFKQIACRKRKSTHSDSVEKSGVTLGNDIGKLLPVELSLYTHPITRMDFLRRFVEGQTMQYEQKGQEVLGKGPIVLCLDQSGSMQNLDNQAKGFTLALISIAKKQSRDFCLILFSTSTQMMKFEKGKIKSSDIINFARTFLGGGTNFALPLERALDVINESRFKKADIVFVTDGEDCVNSSFLETFNKKKVEKDFSVLTLVLGNGVSTIEPFSDKVIKIKSFEDEGSCAAFEI